MSKKINFASTRKIAIIHNAELDTDFRLRALTAGQFNEIFAVQSDVRLTLIHQLAKAIVDDDGNEMYTPEELRDMPLGAYNQLATELNKLHGLNPAASEEIAKN